MPNIFISYRREDSAGHSGRLFDRLREHFGKDHVFMDIAGIEPGVDFVEAIEKAVGSCDAFIVVIGKQWLSVTDAEGRRRLDNPEDFIRLELATALRRNIRVIPVLVQGAVAPSSGSLPGDLKKLSRLQAHEISDNRWDYDVGTLIETLEKVLKKEVPKEKKTVEEEVQRIPPPPPSKFPRWAIAVIAAIVIGIGIYAVWPLKPPAIEVPNVVGESFEKAKFILEQKGLKGLMGGQQPIRERPPGTVLGQDPNPGQEAKQGQKVFLLLAVRPVIEMPDVVGKRIEEARAIIREAGLALPGVKEIKTREKSPGIVLNQNPKPHTRVEPDQKVHLEVAVRPGIEMPNVLGVQFDKAKAILTERGLEVSRIEKPTGERPPGTVVDQNPRQGREVERGQRVELVVASKPAMDKERQRQMARQVAIDYWSALYKKDVARMTKMSSVPFLFGDEMVHNLRELGANFEFFFAMLDIEKDSKFREFFEGSQILSVNVQTVAEFMPPQHEPKLAARMKNSFLRLGFKDDDFGIIILMSVGKEKRKDTMGLLVRNVGGEVKVAGLP